MKKQIFSLLLLTTSLLLFTRCASIKNRNFAEQNKETVRTWFEEGWNQDHNLELVEQCFDPEWTDGNPLRASQTLGYEGIKQMIKDYRNSLTNPHFSITHLHADQTFVTIRYEMNAIHSADLFGVPATGKEFTATGIVLYEMKDGRILTTWAELDVVGIVNQLKN